MKNGVSYWGMKAMTTFSHCWKKEVFSTPCSRMNLLQQLDRIHSFPKVHPISEGTPEQEGLYMRLVTKKDKSLLCLWHQGFRLLPEGRFTSSEISFW